MDLPYIVHDLFLVFGGLGLFLFGMKMMMDGLEELAGNRMRRVVEGATSNRFLGIIVGAVVTFIIQSSTATSLMAIGFINAGLMSLPQAISLIMGAHIGTTFTAHVFAFGIGTVAPLFIFFGLMTYLFTPRKNVKDIGYVLLSVGILFFGLSVMGDPLRQFAGTPQAQAMLVAFENPMLAILAGFVLTTVIQSSTAATGILVTLYARGVDLDFTVAAYLVLGISAGTTVTAIIASFAGRRESKRAALANLIYISIGVIVFGILIQIFPGILLWFQNTWDDGARQLAMFYTFFKIGLTLMFLPLTGHLAALIYKIVPKQSMGTDAKQLLYISDNAQTPDVAIDQAFNELRRMGHMTLENLELAFEALFTGSSKKIAAVVEGESAINYLHRQITSMLMQMQNVESAEDTKKMSTLLYIASDLERIGDHAENIAEYDIRKDGVLRLSPAELHELEVLSASVLEILNLTIAVFYTRSRALVRLIYEAEQGIDALCEDYTENHIMRLKHEDINPRGGVTYTNLIRDLERCSDHANNIAYYFMDETVRSVV